MIFVAAVNSSPTTTTHIPAENMHHTEDLKGNFFLLLGHSHYMLWDYYYELNEMAKRHFFIRVLYRLVAKWPPLMSKTTSI